MVSKALIALFAVLACANAAFGVDIISKAEWGGKAPYGKTWLANGLAYVVVHHTAGPNCTTQDDCMTELRNLQNYHMFGLGWPDIGYNFLIGGDGNVYEGRGWNTVGAHAYGWNSKSFGIAFLGNYNFIKPSVEQVAAAKSLLNEAVARGQIRPNHIVYGHRQVERTDCPGAYLFGEIMTWHTWRP